MFVENDLMGVCFKIECLRSNAISGFDLQSLLVENASAKERESISFEEGDGDGAKDKEFLDVFSIKFLSALKDLKLFRLEKSSLKLLFFDNFSIKVFN